MTNKFNFNQLVMLKHLLETRSVSQAAELACVTQPAASKVLNQIRSTLNDPLIVRVGNQYELSPYAERLLEELRPALYQLESILQPNHFDESSIEDRFVFASSEYFCSYVFPCLSQLLTQKIQRTQFIVKRWETAFMDEFNAGIIDLIALARMEKSLHFTDAQEIECEVFGSDFLVLVAQKDHSILSKTLSSSALSSYTHVIVRHRAATKQHHMTAYDTYYQTMDIKLHNYIEVPEFTSAIKIVENSDCICILPLHIAANLSRYFNVSFCALKNRTYLDYILCWSYKNNNKKNHQWLRKTALAFLKEDFATQKKLGMDIINQQG
ncbi:MAG: LysR family transcriptional regulator [Pseudomonadota bacterium]